MKKFSQAAAEIEAIKTGSSAGFAPFRTLPV